jgi:hypothetical protein
VSPVAAPPGPVTSLAAGPPVPPDPEALFKEAKRRRRRRRLAGLAAFLVLAAAGTIGIIAAGPLHKPAPGPAGTGPARAMPHVSVAPGTSVAWVDFHGHLHLGDLATGSQRVVARIHAYPALPLTQAGGGIFWVDHRGAYVPALHHWSRVVRELDLATGRTHVVGPGQSVFPAADGRHVFISVTDTTLYESPVAGHRRSPRLRRLPAGWFMPWGDGVAVSGGVLVQSVYPLAGVRLPHTSHTFGVWDPRSGEVRPIMRGYDLIGAASPAGAHGGLLAWLPISCSLGQNCRMRITSLPAESTRLVPSPLGRGFASGGAFSPDGRWLAVFVNRAPTLKLKGIPASKEIPDTALLALIDTRTGVLRLVPGTVTETVGPLLAWVRWLPDGRHLIAGGNDSSYLVNTSAMTARPMYFLPGRDHGRDRYIQDTGDLNITAVVVPPRR